MLCTRFKYTFIMSSCLKNNVLLLNNSVSRFQRCEIYFLSYPFSFIYYKFIEKVTIIFNQAFFLIVEIILVVNRQFSLWAA